MEEIPVEATQLIRLDRYLRRKFPNLTQGVIESALRRGQIKVNQKKAKSSHRVIKDDIISVIDSIMNSFKANANFPEKKIFSSNVISLAEKILSTYLIYDSEQFLAINKPYGIAVQGGSKISISIDDALAYLNEVEGAEYKLVHRLDKETSGVLLIARGYDSSVILTKAFKEKHIIKKYLARVSGHPSQSEGFISNYIGKERGGKFECVKELKESGKLAETHYKVISRDSGSSLIEFTPLTGRMHQLRFHSQFLGCPIIGDNKYGGRKHVRMLLHAASVTIDLAVFGKEITIEAKIDNL